MKIDPRSLHRAVCAVAAALALAACATAPAAEERDFAGVPASVGADPKINLNFYSANAALWSGRFEGESREIYRMREAIADASGAKPGMVVADVGAGTGLFTVIFAKRVAPAGKVYAVDISEPFVEAISKRAAAEKLANVSTLVSTHTDTRLAPRSVDIVFTSDVYHHFEQVAPVLASIRQALKPGGRFIVIDFERIPGVTPQSRLDHVRAGKETVIEEITASGFRLRGEVKTLGLKDNYFLVFERL